MRNLVVVTTLGRRDLQAVVVHNGQLWRISPRDDDTGALHRALLAHKNRLGFWIPNKPNHLIGKHEQRDLSWYWENDQPRLRGLLCVNGLRGLYKSGLYQHPPARGRNADVPVIQSHEPC